MEGELFNTIKRQNISPYHKQVSANTDDSLMAKMAHHLIGFIKERMSPAPDFSKISFVPREMRTERGGLSRGRREKCAIAGLAIGVLALISWVVILPGIFISIAGVTLSFIGFKSSYLKYARIGLILSLLGGFASLWYMIAIYTGMINYNYFTNEFWGIPSGGVEEMM